MTVHLIHGFNVSDGGRGSVGRLSPWLHDTRLHDYGWTFLLRLRGVNRDAVRRLALQAKDGDVLVAHSNGCLIVWRLVHEMQARGKTPGAVVCIQPALRRDTRWPDNVPVLCCHNPADWIVSLGRIWGRFASVANPWRNRHGWGAAGRYGFTLGQANVTNLDTTSEHPQAKGHSGIFQSPALEHWAWEIRTWLKRKAK